MLDKSTKLMKYVRISGISMIIIGHWFLSRGSASSDCTGVVEFIRLGDDTPIK